MHWSTSDGWMFPVPDKLREFRSESGVDGGVGRAVSDCIRSISGSGCSGDGVDDSDDPLEGWAGEMGDSRQDGDEEGDEDGRGGEEEGEGGGVGRDDSGVDVLLGE